MSKIKSGSVSQSVSQWQGHLLSCLWTAKNGNTNTDTNEDRITDKYIFFAYRYSNLILEGRIVLDSLKRLSWEFLGLSWKFLDFSWRFLDLSWEFLWRCSPLSNITQDDQLFSYLEATVFECGRLSNNCSKSLSRVVKQLSTRSRLLKAFVKRDF